MAIAATDEAIKVLRIPANVVRRWLECYVTGFQAGGTPMQQTLQPHCAITILVLYHDLQIE
jgi:hypothetical protein